MPGLLLLGDMREDGRTGRSYSRPVVTSAQLGRAESSSLFSGSASGVPATWTVSDLLLLGHGSVVGLCGDPGPRGDGTLMKGLETVQHVGCRGPGDEYTGEGDKPRAGGEQVNILSFVQPLLTLHGENLWAPCTAPHNSPARQG